MKILKFGGKSLSTPEKVQNIGKYIKNIYKKEKNIIIIVSAIGQTTDTLLSLARTYSNNQTFSRELDCLLSTGETQSSALMSMTLNSMGVPTKSFQAFQLEITTFGAFSNSKITYINKQPILECFKNEEVVVVSGFQGINKNNEITTLGRGGSDTTASALGAVFNHDVEIYSDFDGVCSGDPRILNFKKLKSIDYDTMISMSKSGAKVLDSRATEIAKKFNFNIISKSSTLTQNKGTLITDIEEDIISTSVIENLCQISIHFTNVERLKFILNNVILSIKNMKFYNFTVTDEKISFAIKQENKSSVLSIISKKLKLLK